ncbi:hypothetical protein SLS62_006047 [Diatrype stigma]|uniref:Cytochrome P450 n=1 Tax=Diatrype stigma TaxID=117547 RepID=A0AAN9UQ99_9PEZI
MGQLEFTKDKKYHAGADREPTILNANQEYHRYIRRLLAHGFSDKSLREQESVLQGCVNTLFQKLHENGEGGKVALNLVQWYSPLRVKYRSLRDINKEKTESRIQNGSAVPDFMDKLIETYQSGKISFDQLMGNAEVLLGAGSETTATLLSGLTYLLTKNPEVREKLIREIRGTFQSPEEITITAVSQCKYLFACIEEALRLYPPSPQPHQRVVPRGGATVAGRFLPEGVVVSIPVYAASRSPRNWARPDEFVPERWMGEDEKGGDLASSSSSSSSLFRGDAREASQPFSYGPRNCLGKNLAYVEMKIIVARLVWHFDVEMEDSDEDDWFDQKVYTIWEKKPLWVKLHPVQRG